MRLHILTLLVLFSVLLPATSQASEATRNAYIAAASQDLLTAVPKHKKPCSCKKTLQCSVSHCAIPEKTSHSWLNDGKQALISPYNTELLLGWSPDITPPPPKFV